jgi:hypothetical protein
MAVAKLLPEKGRRKTPRKVEFSAERGCSGHASAARPLDLRKRTRGELGLTSVVGVRKTWLTRPFWADESALRVQIDVPAPGMARRMPIDPESQRLWVGGCPGGT